MRPLRLLLSLFASLAAVLLLIFVALSPQQDEQLEQNSNSGKQGGFKALFSFTSPGSLFPPSAIISLTDDNSTFFLARPAAFGPTLPQDGLSSPLWIGSGFGDDAMGRGELGCGDSPDWDTDYEDVLKKPLLNDKSQLSSDLPTKDMSIDAASAPHNLHDGTDDHLHASASDHPSSVYQKSTTEHSDIRTLQETAEIEGKVVLLKRGGCGFLAKVLWAQRRGAVAVIVGDDVRGGGLIRMYAKGDTSNVTISSLFTSHTTAHLLSSLLPRGATHGLPTGAAIGISDAANEQPANSNLRPISTASSPKIAPSSVPNAHEAQTTKHEVVKHKQSLKSWIGRLLSALGFRGPAEGSTKAGHPDGLQTEPWNDGQNLIKTKGGASKPISSPASDGFTIGQQDWRDSDKMPTTTPTIRGQTMASSALAATKTGGGVLPGSGEYLSAATTDSESEAWWSKWIGSHDDASTPKAKHVKSRSITSITNGNLETIRTTSDSSVAHEGLWVTLTPTSVSTSPFFDTLLVLVVSPLVTLTVVYALLLLRSRIRRRRWRAPKSLVDRLPVRTYHTISESSSIATPHAASPTTPLLRHSPSRSVSPLQSGASYSEDEEQATSSANQASTRNREEEKRQSGLAEWRRRYGGRQRECVVCLDEYEDGVSQVMSLPCGHEFHAECIKPWLVTRRRTCPICKGDVVKSLAESCRDPLPSPSTSLSSTRSNFHFGDMDDVQAQAAERYNDTPSASLPMPISASTPASNSRYLEDADLEANWSGDELGQGAGEVSANATVLGSSLRDLSSTVSTVIWRGVDVVRNTTGIQRRQPEGVDRDR